MGRPRGLLSAAELAEEIQARLQDEINNMSGVALVQAWKQIHLLAKEEAQQVTEGGPTLTVLDIVSSAELPRDRKLALLEAEWKRLMDELGQVAAAIEEITGAQGRIDEELKSRTDALSAP